MIWVQAAIALVVSFLSIFALRPLLTRLGVVDVPNERSSHSTVTVRGAGLAPLLGIVIAAAFAAFSAGAGNDSAFWVFVGTTAACAVLGMIEDVVGIPVAPRAGLQLLVGLGGSIAMVVALGAPGWWVLVGVFAVAGGVNVANFMDGINGISGAHAIVVGGVYALLGAIFFEPWMTLAGLLVAFAFLGFLPWNLVRGRVFLGDSGSYLLGGAIAIIAVGAMGAGVPFLAVLGPVTIYIADSGYTLARRILRGERWYEAHRTHVYQRMTDHGLGHVSVSLVVAGFSLLTSALGFVSIQNGWVWTTTSAAGLILVAVTYLALPKLFGNSSAQSQDQPSGGRLGVSTCEGRARRVDEFSKQRWVVVGATGFVGSTVTNHLRDLGADVLTVTAPRLSLQNPASSEQVCAVDEIDTESALAAAFRGRDIVVNAAGLAVPDSGETADLWGANSLLPVVVARAAQRASVRRFVHLSSAAVQGSRPVLDETSEVSPFSPYSRSKALGEQALTQWNESNSSGPSVVIVRATSVQGPGRRTTEQLRRIAKLPIASVAAPGTQPTPITSVTALADFVTQVGSYPGSVSPVVLQPWEGMTTKSVLEAASGRKPMVLPASLCRLVIRVGTLASRMAGGRLAGSIRRVELMWFGQAQTSTWSDDAHIAVRKDVRNILRGQAVQHISEPPSDCRTPASTK